MRLNIHIFFNILLVYKCFFMVKCYLEYDTYEGCQNGGHKDVK